MAGKPQYDWPSIEGLIALVREHGQIEAAKRLGVPRATLKSHLDRHGVEGADRVQAPRSLNEDALKEVARLVK